MSSSFGDRIRFSVFGQSHSTSIGIVIDGLPAGVALDFDRIAAFMKRRQPGQNSLSTSRVEPDLPKIQSGIVDSVTCGAPLCAIFDNTNTRSSDYNGLKSTPRPSHADYTAWAKHGGFNDISGGGHFSGRLTAPLTFAGAICSQILEQNGVSVVGKVFSIAGVCDDKSDLANPDIDAIKSCQQKEIAVLNDTALTQMKQAILDAKHGGDSVGGVVECFIKGAPVGIGEPMFDGVENRIAKAIFGIPAVRAIEFGAGFDAANMLGSAHNDAFIFDDGIVKTATNNHGGALGGITSGMPIAFRVAFKPTPSIAKPQQTVDLKQKTSAMLEIKGRHDPCIVPRAVVVVEAVAACVLLDMMM